MASKKKTRFMGQYKGKEKKEGRHQLNQVKKDYPTKKSWKKVTSLGNGGKVKVVKKNKPK